jgi:protein-disulfide isomerase
MTLEPPIATTDHVAGSSSARITLVEYGDYQCPRCAAAEPVMRALRRALGSELRFVFRNFPMSQTHPAAEAAAELAEAAAVHGKFWDAHSAIFAWSRRYGPEAYDTSTFTAIARGIGLDPRDTLEAITEHRYLQRIRNDFYGGVRSGASTTPTFFLNGQRYNGSFSENALARAIVAAVAM